MIKQKNIFAITFIGITLFYLVTRWYIFLGFNGADDLHYAMLSSRMLNRTFNPFVLNDIFCGRIALIGWQAIIYRFAGISVLTTQIGTLFATILSCYLTVFKIMKPKTTLHVLLGCSFFYFNPALSNATLGILPDSYIMLLGIYFVIATKNLLSDRLDEKLPIKSLWLGILIGMSLLIKEISILFLFFTILTILIYKPKQSFQKIALLVIGFLLVISAIGLYYYIHTGNFFFKIAQINNSDYRNTLHQEFELKNLVIRLTYGPWKIFVIYGFYPLVIAGFIVVLQFFTRGWQYVRDNYYLFSFLLLLLLSLYFPFSLQEFKPLYIEPRHFIFLLPIAVVICSEYMYAYFAQLTKTKLIPLLFFCLLAICIYNTGNKWQWMIYGLFAVLFFIQAYFSLNFRNMSLITCSILWLSLLENAFFQNYPWFKEMQSVNRNIAGDCFYFIDNDNMMHWELLHKFDKSNAYFNMERKPFFMFSAYYPKINDKDFRPGWLIMNNVYSPPSYRFKNIIRGLNTTNTFKKQFAGKYIEALYIADSGTLSQLATNME